MQKTNTLVPLSGCRTPARAHPYPASRPADPISAELLPKRVSAPLRAALLPRKPHANVFARYQRSTRRRTLIARQAFAEHVHINPVLGGPLHYVFHCMADEARNRRRA